MRALFCAFLAVGLVCALCPAAEEIPFAPASVVCEASSSPSSIHLTVEDRSEIPFAQPVVRLVNVPPGANEPEILYAPGKTDAPVEIWVGAPVIIRGVRAVPVIISPAPGKREAPDSVSPLLEFTIRYEEGGAFKAPSASPGYSRGFYAPFQNLFANSDLDQLHDTSEGSYVIVTSPGFVTAVEPLAAWKREMGYPVTVVTTDEIGTVNSEIQAYIRDLYSNSAIPPQYVLIVGDVEQVPAFDYHQSVSDLPYSLMDGDDFFPDLEVGRLSAETEVQVNTIVAKVVGYEKEPYTEDTEWFTRALMIGGNTGSVTPKPVSRWCGDQLRDIGFTAIDSVYSPPCWTLGNDPEALWPCDRPLINMSIDQGVSIVSYRGWAYSYKGWEPPHFTIDEIPSVNNGRKLPVVFSFVCDTGNYAEPDNHCFGELFLRVGTPTEPKGAVGFIGNSERWSHTRHNDAAAIGAFTAIKEDSVRGMGQILNASKYGIMKMLPERFYYDADDPLADESVEFYFYIYSLLGDPSMEIWTSAPQALTVLHPESVAEGSSLIEVTVQDETGLNPVADARVGISQGENVLGCARTDGNGIASAFVNVQETGDPITVTVTGRSLAPYQEDVNVTSGEAFLAYKGVQVTESTGEGNNDGIPNPGETLELKIDLENSGATVATNVSATLEAIRGATLMVGASGFPNIAAGAVATSSDSFLVSMAPDAEDGLVAQFRLESNAGANAYPGGFELTVQAPDLMYASHALDGDGILDPGETAELTATIQNDGSVPTTGIEAVLRSATPSLASVVDSVAAFGGIAVGLTGENNIPFTVEAEDTAAIGQAAAFTLLLTTAEGYVQETSFSVIMGKVDHRAPLGPDGYGYYAYDNSDTDYPNMTPVYEWIPCSPNYGGSGTALDLGDNDKELETVVLPFSFKFYGVTYDTILVSDNGWISFELPSYFDFYNWSLPTLYGNGAIVAPFWDNLDPEKEHDELLVGDGIYVFDDSENDRFVVEWSRLGNKRSHHEEEHRPDYDELQTFQLVLFDPAVYETPTGDGIVKFQYKQIVNNDYERMYATVGIESHDEGVALEYTYANSYPEAAAPLSAGLAIEFSTKAPRYDPFRFASFHASATDDGVLLQWEPSDDRPRSEYRVYRSSGDEEYRIVDGGYLEPAVLEFLDEEADPRAEYSYKIGSIDRTGYEAMLGPYAYDGSSTPVLRLALRSAGPNPFRGSTPLSYSLPEKTTVRLRIYTVSGRLVRTLIDGRVNPGLWTAQWDGKDEGGREVPSGVDFARLEAGQEQRRVKLTLLR